MTTTPMVTVNNHLAAMNKRDRNQFIETLAFPFIHIQPSGERVIWTVPEDVPATIELPFSRSEFIANEIIATSGEVTVYFLRFQRYDNDDNPLNKGEGLWGLGRTGEVWKVIWRQYLGLV